ncbi:endonuclease/exonuclease/phosphatase family protein [bacterium]|nr:endonuclease/exonuclease/phosphatase family protein [bacterium]
MMKISLVTLNVRYDNSNDGPNQWCRRKALVGEFLRQKSPDWIALQEVLPSQRRDLEAMLTDYRSYGISRDGQGRDEQCCWLVRDPWWFEEARTVWLSDTPQQVSVGWDAMLPRVASLVRVGGVWAANVHLDHHGPEARRRGVELAASLLPADQPGLLVGDFNQADVWQQAPALAGWQDAQRWAGQTDRGTFHDFQGGLQGPRIDAILCSPAWRPTGFELIEDPRLSDHYPLWAQLEATEA